MAETRAPRRIAGRVLLGVLLLASAVAVALELRHADWSVLGTAVRGRSPATFALLAGLSVLANAAALIGAMLAWWALLVRGTERVSLAAAARIYCVGTFAKYVPGKVFGYVASVHMGRTLGVPAARVLSAWLSTLVIGLLTGGTVGLLAAPTVLGGSAVWLSLAAAPTVAVLVWPELVGRAAGVLARLRRRPPPEDGVPARAIRTAIVAQLLSWLAGGVSLWLLAMALGAPALHSLPLGVGAFSLATVVGMFAVFAPEGLGVRELILLSALGVAMPLPVAGVVALLSRLTVLVSELATAGIGMLATSPLLGRTPRNGQGIAAAAALGSSTSEHREVVAG